MAGYVLAVIGIFLGDLWIKDRIEGSDTDKSGNVLGRGRDGDCRKPMTLAGGRIRIRKYHNEGAMLNLGQRRRKAVAALSVALTGAVGGMFLCSLGQRGNRLLRAGLALAEAPVRGGLSDLPGGMEDPGEGGVQPLGFRDYDWGHAGGPGRFPGRGMRAGACFLSASRYRQAGGQR